MICTFNTILKNGGIIFKDVSLKFQVEVENVSISLDSQASYGC